jgi:prevent-host-death family protein
VFVLSTNQKGAIAEEAIALEAAKLDIVVSRPRLDARYGLILDLGPRLLRVQCKWANLAGAVVTARARGCWHSPRRGYVRSNYAAHEVDAIGLYCADLERCYLVPIEVLAGQSMVHLRLEPTANGQKACLHWAADYEFVGAVAQMARARDWQSRGRGFESPQLHPTDQLVPDQVGANEFRNRFGWYMQRAAAGEEIRIARRGRPFARLLPPVAASSAASFDSG